MVRSLRVHAKDAAPLTPELATSLRGVVFDYESMVRARGRFDEEARAAVQDRKLVTPIGTFELPKGADIAFSGAALLTDGEGKVLRRDRQFTAGKVDFWAGAQYEGLRFSCMTDRDDVWQEVSTFYDRDTTKPVKERTIHLGGDKPTPFLGATGVVVKGKGPEFAPGDRRSLDRTLLRADGMIYMFTVSRMGNGQMGDKVARQLRTATPRCDP